MAKGNMKSSQKERAPDLNERAIQELLAAFEADMAAADESGKPYLPDPLIAICRIEKAPSSEWFDVMLPKGKMTRVTGESKSTTFLVWEMCRGLTATQANLSAWPVVIVSLPKPYAKKQTGEILAILSLGREESVLLELLERFKALGHILPGANEGAAEGAAAGGGGGFLFSKDAKAKGGDDEPNIDAI
jgi:hypothetical protein